MGKLMRQDYPWLKANILKNKMGKLIKVKVKENNKNKKVQEFLNLSQELRSIIYSLLKKIKCLIVKDTQIIDETFL